MIFNKDSNFLMVGGSWKISLPKLAFGVVATILEDHLRARSDGKLAG
jgi:hypothetical protein